MHSKSICSGESQLAGASEQDLPRPLQGENGSGFTCWLQVFLLGTSSVSVWPVTRGCPLWEGEILLQFFIIFTEFQMMWMPTAFMRKAQWLESYPLWRRRQHFWAPSPGFPACIHSLSWASLLTMKPKHNTRTSMQKHWAPQLLAVQWITL